MGLSGRKVKQRIGTDPRNLSWADDAARFGSSYLSKFGWDASKGLGVDGGGRTSHIKVAQKMDMMGIGAAHQRDPNGMAWKQNRDFEMLLKRLNGGGVGGAEEGGIVVDGFVKPNEKPNEDENQDGRKEEEKKKKKKKKKDVLEKEKKKRKRDEETEDVDGESKKKVKKGGDAARNATPRSPEPEELKSTLPEAVSTIGQKPARIVPRHRSHRARHIAAKSIHSKSATAISEILGIAPVPSLSSSATPSGTQTPQEGKLTSIYDDHCDTPEVDKIKTSTQSLQDYFKERIGRSKERSAPQSTAVGAHYDDPPRAGLGSRPKAMLIDDDRPKTRVVSSSFMAATSLLYTAKSEDSVVKSEEVGEAAGDEEEEKRRKKEKKRLKKERKRND